MTIERSARQVIHLKHVCQCFSTHSWPVNVEAAEFTVDATL
jgi:hypothetical protein